MRIVLLVSGLIICGIGLVISMLGINKFEMLSFEFNKAQRIVGCNISNYTIGSARLCGNVFHTYDCIEIWVDIEFGEIKRRIKHDHPLDKMLPVFDSVVKCHYNLVVGVLAINEIANPYTPWLRSLFMLMLGCIVGIIVLATNVFALSKRVCPHDCDA